MTFTDVQGALQGWKTYIVGLGAIGAGAFLVSRGQTEQGWTLITFGLGLLGLGAKGNRMHAEIQALRAQLASTRKH